MSRAEMEKAVRDVYTARLSNNIKQALDYFDESSRFVINGAHGTSPIALDVSTRPTIDEVLTELFKAWEWVEQDILHILIDGDHAAVHYRLKVRFTLTSEMLETEICDLLTFKAGKLMQVVEFLDTALVERMLAQLHGASPSASAA